MKTNRAISQKIGLVIFILGGLYMFGLGWLYSWWMVPAANQIGGNAYSGSSGFLWGLSVPLGAFIVAIGAALVAKLLVGAALVLSALLILAVVFVLRRIRRRQAMASYE